MELKNLEYIHYLASDLEKEFRKFEPSGDLRKIISILRVIKKTQDPLKDIYIFSKINDLELFSTYLLFIVKKLQTGEINFGNLVENLESDKHYITKEFAANFNLENSATKEDLKRLDTDSEEYIKEDETKAIISELEIGNDFNETLEEEFLHSEFEITEIKSGNLELLPSEDFFDKTEAFNLPENKKPVEKHKQPVNTESENISELPATLDSESILPFKEKHKKKKILKSDETVTSIGFATKVAGKAVIETAAKLFKKKKFTGDEEEEPVKKILINTLESDGKPEIAEKCKKKDKKKRKQNEQEIYEKNEKHSEPPEVDNEDTEFKVYESYLFDSNKLIELSLENLNAICDSNIEKAIQTNVAAKDIKLKELEKKHIGIIICESDKMEQLSSKISFEVIASVYSTIKLSLQNIIETGYGLDNDTIKLFSNAVLLIQKLINGEDYSNYENIVPEIESRRKDLISHKEQTERRERLEKEKNELEKQLGEKYSKTEQRKTLVLLKNRILDIQNIFQSLNDIKEEYQIYEALRRLGNTIGCFKDIVKYSNELTIPKLAQLAEASYVFIKYVQNYRMNPFTEEVREVMKYIIINYKLVMIDKPSKDVDVFISFLNNPERIFAAASDGFKE